MATGWVARSLALAAIASTTAKAQFECNIANHIELCQTNLGYRTDDGCTGFTFIVPVSIEQGRASPCRRTFQESYYCLLAQK